MSEDLIRRSDAIKAIEVVDWYHQNRNKDMVSGANSSEHQAWYKADDIYKALEAVPVAETKRGEWVNQHEWSNGFFERECSVCGAMKPLLRHTAKINYCPNCGADMRGKGDE